MGFVILIVGMAMVLGLVLHNIDTDDTLRTIRHGLGLEKARPKDFAELVLEAFEAQKLEIGRLEHALMRASGRQQTAVDGKNEELIAARRQLCDAEMERDDALEGLQAMLLEEMGRGSLEITRLEEEKKDHEARREQRRVYLGADRKPPCRNRQGGRKWVKPLI
jgi:hypothetical protein